MNPWQTIADFKPPEWTCLAITSLAGNDGIFGGDADDSLDGGSGSDMLTADNGNGSLDGNLGNELLSGGLGNDALTGGAGSGAFVFNTAIGATKRDTITDFSVTDDTIRLDDAIFTGLATRALLRAPLPRLTSSQS